MTDNNLKQLEAQVQTLTALNSQLSANGYNTEDEIDLRELWNAIREGKWLIIAISAVFAIGSVLYALSLPDEYKSTALLAPASSGNSSSLSKLAGQFGGLASLAGINLGSADGTEDKSVVAMEIIKTWGFLETFVKDNHLEVDVIAAKGWNRSSNKLIINPKLYDETNNKWVREFDANKGQTAVPSGWELYKAIKNKVSISQDEITGLISLTVEYYSPFVAKQWVDKLVKAINLSIQNKDKEEAIKSIEYLNGKIKETNITDMQTVFYQLIEEQTKTLMLAEVSDEYVFKTLSSARVAEEKSKPKRAFVAILGTLLGGMLSVIIVLVRHFRNNN